MQEIPMQDLINNILSFWVPNQILIANCFRDGKYSFSKWLPNVKLDLGPSQTEAVWKARLLNEREIVRATLIKLLQVDWITFGDENGNIHLDPQAKDIHDIVLTN